MLVYDTAEQAQMRLQGTIITHGPKAVYVREVFADDFGVIKLALSPYPLRTEGDKKGGKNYTVDASDPDLNFRVFHLGYCNDEVGRRAIYVSRATTRQQSQGLNRRGFVGNLMDYTTSCQGFEDMLFNKYPSVADAKALLRNEAHKLEGWQWTAVAISRDFAIRPDEDFRDDLVKLLYRGVVVGVSMGGDNFKLAAEYDFLKEVVEETGLSFNLN